MRDTFTPTVTDVRKGMLTVDQIFNIVIEQLEKSGELEPEYLRTHFGDVLKKIENNAHVLYLQAESGVTEDLIDRIAEELPPYAGKKEIIRQSVSRAVEFEYRTGQSRKSRGGSTYQKAVSFLLSRLGIPHIKPAGKEKKEFDEIDFIIPSAEYARKMPDDTILLSVKRTGRERWKQVVSERAMTHVFLILHDTDDLSSDKIELIKKNKIILYVYDEIKRKEMFRNEDSVRSLNDLPDRLKRYQK